MRKLFAILLFTLLSMVVHAGDKNQDYILGAGDVVRISVYGNPDMTTETRVTTVGTITFPLLGEIKVGGMTPNQAEKQISAALEDGGFLKQAQVNFVVQQFQSQLVSVLGDVYKPGRYPLDRASTLTDVLAMAGGATSNGSEIVTVTSAHDGKSEKREYDLREWFDRGQLAHNPAIHGDDIIFVQAREVSVLGQVNRPGKYSVVSGVRNVGDFLSMAGGIAPSGADTIVVSILRNGKVDKREIDIDQLFRNGDTAANIELRGGDMIYVPRQPLFYIYGEVQRPGAFRLERNMTVAQALSVGGGLTVRGTERGIRVKRRNDAGAVQTLELKPSDTLQADDVIQVQESLF